MDTNSTPCSTCVWTTEDELGHVRRLAAIDDKTLALRLLRTYLRLSRCRVWTGPGMAVEAGAVILEAEDAIAEIKRTLGQEESAEAAAATLKAKGVVL